MVCSGQEGVRPATVTGIVTQVSDMSPTKQGLTDYFQATLMNEQDETKPKKRLAKLQVLITTLRLNLLRSEAPALSKC